MHDPVALEEYDTSWPERFERERARLLEGLGHITRGGPLWSVEHVGSTSVPSLPARAEIDIWANAHPFPLEPDRVAALEALGYRRQDDPREEPHVYRTADGIRLEVFGEPGDAWADAIVWRDHLRADARAAREYAEVKRSLAGDPAAYAAGKRERIAASLSAARATHLARTGWTPVLDVAAELEGIGCPWVIASGWALDLFEGRPSRYHHDLDVSVYRRDQLALRGHLLARGWTPYAVRNARYEPWPDGVHLEPPVFQVHAWRDGEFLDVLFAETRASPDGTERWSWRRQPEIVRDLDRTTLVSSVGVPVLAPEIALLYKSHSRGGDPRSKDQRDFERVAGRLEPERRAWLRAALEEHAPGYPWLERL